MRAGGLCTVSAPLAACSPAAALPPAARFLALHLLHQQTLYFIVQVKSRVRELYQQTCLHFAQQGMKDTELFGLALICDGEYLFAESDSKLSKYAPKSWKSSHSHGLDANGRPALAFYFRVQFYVDSPLLLRDETTRHHYYLQLRFNVAAGAATDKVTQQLAGLALQADLGDYRSPTETTPSATNSNAATTVNTTFRPEDYVPPNMRGPQALRSVEGIYRSYRGLTKAEARARFIAEACQSQDPINAHVFRLRASKNEVSPGSLTLAVCARGLLVCPDNNPPSTFLWSSIAKLSFERKKFEIRTNHEKLTLYSTSDEKSRLLLALCKATHQFSMAVAPRLNEMRREEEDRQKRRWDCDQRISVISSTSSNTTSGIVSDRVHSEDELEIMITSPPAPSTESLALAHLLDSAPASCRTSAASATVALVTMSLKDEETISAKMNFKSTNSESSNKTIASGKCTADSQCSSSCSTVIVTPVQNKSKIRRPSTSSSLELGFSHTAQNSTVSDATCIELDTRDPVYLAAGAAPSSQTSGVYTLTSSDQYTMSSSTCGQYSTSTEDQVDGPFRDRCNSGSFRGDGSDPTGKQPAPLSAEELSDLIVGRYPSCKSVSNTLDSDSDYVTLPSSYGGYPPKSPERLDSIVDMRFRPPPPPYPAARIHDDSEEAVLKEPPPYPDNIHMVIPPLAYPSEEVTARFITTRSPNILTAHASHVGGSSAPSFSKTTFVPPIPPKAPRTRPSVALIDTSSKTNMMVPRTFLPPPPPPAPRQPPPPPPPALATVYTSQLSRSQIEQYQQQMYSDVDFVVFPLKEPAISKQEYLEAKQGSLMAALAHSPPYIYRSAPYLNRYASSQNLSDTYIQLPIYGAASISSSGSLDPPPPPLPPNRPGRFMRTRSDDNILNSLEATPQPPRFRRVPPPPPPPPPPLRDRKVQVQMQHKNIDSIGIIETDRNCTNGKNDNKNNVLLSATSVLSNEKKDADDVAAAAAAAAAVALDIRTLREKSKKMDLPLISALCNDRSLIKQTKAFVLPKHPNGEGISGVDASPHHRHHHPVGTSVSKVKYPVSGLSSNRINKPTRKLPPVSHRHPGDKLPEIPRDIPRATPNNYVLQDPRIIKHKTMQSFPSANMR